MVFLFVELEHCGHFNDSEKFHQVILAISECREICSVIFGAVLFWLEVVGGGRRQ